MHNLFEPGRLRAWSRGALLGVAMTAGVSIAAAGSGCAGSFCPAFVCNGGAWAIVQGEGGAALPDGLYRITLGVDGDLLTLDCAASGGVLGGPCVDTLLSFGDSDFVAIGEVALSAAGNPVLSLRTYRRESIKAGAHTYGPDSLSVRVDDDQGSLIRELSATPTYLRRGTSRCGLCDEIEETVVLELPAP